MKRTFQAHQPFQNSQYDDLHDRPAGRFSPRRGSPFRRYHPVLTVLLALALAWSLFFRGGPPPPLPPPPGQIPSSSAAAAAAAEGGKTSGYEEPNLDAAAFFKTLYAPLIHRDLSTSATYFSDATNTTKKLDFREAVWTEPLGNSVLIVDLDTRSFSEKNHVLDDDFVAWEDLERGSAGILNHYMYCASPASPSLPPVQTHN